jgi:FkbM family methyltransferase
MCRKILDMNSFISKFNYSVQCNGLLNTVRNKWGSFYNNRIRRWMGAKVEGKTYTLRTKASKFPLHCRLSSSDPYVFRQVFMDHEYSVLQGLKDVRLIIDCGANVGYSAAYFLTLYPEAKLIAIEPDSANFAILERNLKPYGDRVHLHMAGIWSHKTGLTVCRGTYRDGAEWSTQVRASLPGETPDVEAIDIGTLLRESGHAQVDVLKIDIERSETVVFGENYAEWLGKTRNLAIEIHDDECERIFQAAIAGYPFAISRNEHVVVCKTG